MESRIHELIAVAGRRAIAVRRDLHRYPEVAWTEFRTASLVARRLTELGWTVQLGRQVVADGSRLGLPSDGELDACYQRAAAEGGDPDFLPALKGGYTGVVGVLTGARPGPTVALRVDMDALEVVEAGAATHKPVSAGFSSTHPGLMHACGHDGHTSIGLGVAEVLAALRQELAGTVKLIFQPGEEGGRGGRAMADAGVCDDVDFLIASHLGLDVPSGHIFPAVEGFLSSTKLDVTLRGLAAHAGGRPEAGRNAMLGAAQAVMGLYAISRHSDGASRVNVGVLQAGTGRNVIPDEAFMKLETRGVTAEIDAYMQQRARAILQGAAVAHDLELQIEVAGMATTASCDGALVKLLGDVARQAPGVLQVSDKPLAAGGSEDATFLIKKVQGRGGLATYIGIGSDIPSGHHTRTFDINELDLERGIGVLALAAMRLCNHGI